MTVEPRVPEPEGPNAEFYAHAAGGTLHLQHCIHCNAFQHPPRVRCGACGSAGVEWVASSGEGRLWSWTVTHVPFDRRWKEAVPYVTGVVELDKGVRLIGALPDVAPDDLELDIPVRAELEPYGEEFSFISFRRR